MPLVLINIVLPTVLFYVFYNISGIMPAVIISAAYSLITVIYGKIRNYGVRNSQIIGFLGLIGSAAAILFTGEEKLYYVPAIIENVIFLGFMIILTARHKSVIHYLAKDFEIKSLEQIPEDKMISINVIWIIYFVLKIISKIVGILCLNFNELYWMVFILGDPMTIVMIIMSIIMLRMSSTK